MVSFFLSLSLSVSFLPPFLAQSNSRLEWTSRPLPVNILRPALLPLTSFYIHSLFILSYALIPRTTKTNTTTTQLAL